MYTSVADGLQVRRIALPLTESGRPFTARSVTIQFSVDVLTPLPVTFHCFGNRHVVDAAVLFVVRLKSPSVTRLNAFAIRPLSTCGQLQYSVPDFASHTSSIATKVASPYSNRK